MAGLTSRALESLPRIAITMPIAFIASAAIGTLNLGFLFVVKEVYLASPSQVGWFGALWSIFYFAGCIALRKPVAALEPRLATMVATVSSAALIGLSLVCRSLEAAFVLYGLCGLSMAFFWPPLMAWFAEGLEGKALNSATGKFSVSWSLGGVISPTIAGILSEIEKFIPLYVSLALFLSCAGLILWSSVAIPWKGWRKAVVTLEGDAGRQARGGSPLRFPAWLGIALLYAVMGVVFTVFPVFAKDELGLSESIVGLLLTLRAGATMLGFAFFGRTSFWQERRYYIPLVSIAALAVTLALAFSRQPILIGLFLVIAGFVLASAYQNSIFYGSSGASDRAKRMAIHEASLTGGQILGSVAGGFIYQGLDMRSVFLGLCALLLAGTAVQAALAVRGSRDGFISR